jgi:hypothetical protein
MVRHSGIHALCYLTVLCCAYPVPSAAFAITAPVADTVVRPGQEVPVTVELGTETGMLRVRYYWYGQFEEPLPAQLASPALIATSASIPPYGGAVRVPSEAIGTMRLLAVGEVVRGRLAGSEEFDEILLQVQPQAELTSIEFDVEKPWRLDTLGKILETPVVGQFADGITRRIGGASSGSAYQSSDDRVVQVSSDGSVRVIGNGKAKIVVTNRGKQGILNVLVRSPEGTEGNRAPIARAAPALTVKAGTTVVLSALSSSDPDGDPLKYEWAQVRGHKVSLLDPDTPKATFVAPRVSQRRLLGFRLRVTDMVGPDTVKGADSQPAFVTVWVDP